MRRVLCALAAALIAATPALAGVTTTGAGKPPTAGGGGGGSFLPSDLGAQVPYWFDASDATGRTTSGGLITALANKGAVGSVSAAQATSSEQPTLSSAALNGKDVATFDGDGTHGDHLDTGSITINPPTANVSFFYVSKRGTTSSVYSTAIGMSESSSSGIQIGFAGGAGPDWASNDLIVITDGDGAGRNPRGVAHPIAVSDTAWHIVSIDMGSTLADIYVDGTAATMLSSGTAAWSSITQPLTLGASSASGSTGDAANGQIAEWIIAYDLNSTNRQKIEGYLACKYGLQGSLPGGHPYKSVCP